jgi:hypothetical protein
MNEMATLATNLGSGGAASSGMAKSTMTSEMTAFVIAVGGASVACYLLMSRAETRRAKGQSSRDGSTSDGGGYGDSNGGSIFGWFAGDHHSAADSSGNPADSGGGGGDSGGGNDGGGGDGGGGGGSD